MVSHAGTQNFRTVAPFLHGLVQGFVDEKLMEWDGWVAQAMWSGSGCAGYVVGGWHTIPKIMPLRGPTYKLSFSVFQLS